jgi:hypothetical protein
MQSMEGFAQAKNLNAFATWLLRDLTFIDQAGAVGK